MHMLFFIWKMSLTPYKSTVLQIAGKICLLNFNYSNRKNWKLINLDFYYPVPIWFVSHGSKWVCINNGVCIRVCRYVNLWFCMLLVLFLCLPLFIYWLCSILICSYLFILEAYLFSNEIEKKGWGFEWVGRWGRSGRSKGMENHN